MAGLDRETLDQVLEALDEYARRRLPEARLLELDRLDEFPVEVVREMSGPELGIGVFFMPEEFHGMGSGAFDLYRICERMARVDLGVATGLFATFLGSEPIGVGGTAAQKERWLTRIADEGLIMAYAATEPAAGSDLAALRTTATRIEENGALAGYRLSGSKQWISNGGYADLYTVLANAPGGPSWFVVPRGAPGFSWGKPEDKHGIRASNTAALSFDDVYVPAGDLIGEVEGQGLVQAQAVFGYTRLMVAAFGLGAGWAALDRAIAYSTTRLQGGAPLAEKQGYTHKLIVPHAARLEAARAFLEETAVRIDRGEPMLNTEGAIAKYLATESGNRAADAAIQALGGYGYVKEYLVEKIRRDVRITTIYEGTSEIMEMTIARDRWQTHLKSRGQHYHAEGRALEDLAARSPASGAGTAALAAHALAEVLERCRVARLTRHQHILLRLGELTAFAEGAAAFARRAAAARDGQDAGKGDRRFDAAALCTLSRIFAREAALKVAGDGIAWIAGADGAAGAELEALERAAGREPIERAQAGLLADLDVAAGMLYGRASTTKLSAA